MGFAMAVLRILFLWIFGMTWISGQKLEGKHICRTKTLAYCCRNYVQVGNICVECEPGYFGNNCSMSCPPHHYGRKCSHKCNCSPSEYCDVRWGCLCNETSLNCTNPSTNPESDTRDRYQETADQTVVNVVLPCLLSAIFILLIGLSSLRIWNKLKLRRVKKETRELGDVPDDSSFDNASQTPQTGERQPEDTYAHSSYGIYNHVNLRVQYSKESVYDTGKRLDIDRSPSCPGLPPDTISEQDEEPVQNTHTDSQSESDDSDNTYFDVSYTGQMVCNVREPSGHTSSLTSNWILDDDDSSDYVNLENTQPENFYDNEVYSCNEDVILRRQHLSGNPSAYI